MGLGDRKEKVKQIRQDDILNAAEKVFFTKGFVNSTMDEVAREAEYSKRTVYSYFTSKEQIYDAIILRAYQNLNRMFDETLTRHQPANGLDKVMRLGETYLDFIDQFPKYFEAIIYYQTRDEDLATQDEIKAASYREGEVSVARLVECIREGINDGSIAKDLEPVATAFVLYANLIGIGNIIFKKKAYIRHRHQRTVAQLIAEQMKLLCKGLSAERGS